MKSQYVETIKELVRTAVIAALAVVIASLTSTGTIDAKAVGLAALIAFLRAVDKFAHESDNLPSPLDLTSLDVLKN